MQIQLYSERQNGLSTKSLRVLLRQNQDYRLGEVVLPLDADALDVLADQHQALWDGGEIVNIAWWIAATQRRYREYFYGIQIAVDGARLAGGTLDILLAAGLQAIAQDDTKAAEFAQYRSILGLSDIVNDTEKRDLMNLIITWSNAGIIGGGLG